MKFREESIFDHPGVPKPALGPIKKIKFGLFLAPGVVRNGFLAKFHAGLTYFHNISTDFLKIVIIARRIG